MRFGLSTERLRLVQRFPHNADMDVRNREKLESQMNEVLFVVWNEWSKVRDPSTLTQEKLEALLEKHCMDKVWALWVRANLDLLKEFDKEQNDAALAAAFLLFFTNWRRSLSERWVTRVRDWEYSRDQQEAERSRAIERQQATSSEPSGSSSGVSGGSGSRKPAEIDEIPPAPPKWKEARDLIVQDHDIEREAVTSVTEIQTDGESNAAKEIEAEEYILPFWKAEPGACDFCAPLHNKPPNVWRKVSLGPPAHPHCVLGDSLVSVPGLVSCMKATYTGNVFRVTMCGGAVFTVTTNHMLMSYLGFIRAVDIREGDRLVRVSDLHNDRHEAAETVFNRCLLVDRWQASESGEVDGQYLHGDGENVSGKVQILHSPSDVDRGPIFGSQRTGGILERYRQLADFSTDVDREKEALQTFAIDNPNRAKYVDAFEDMRELHPNNIAVSEVVSVVMDFVTECPVYDFETTSTVYTVGYGIVSSNCRCWLEWRRVVE